MAANPDACELLREVAKSVCGASGAQLAPLTAAVGDWESVLALALEHRVSPFLFKALAEQNIPLPSAVQAELESDSRNNALRCVMNAGELIALLREFERESIPAIPFKGVALAVSAYGELTARNAGDLDLLIHYRDLLRATAMMKSRGYELKTKSREDGTPAFADYYEYHFERSRDGMVAELRWRLELSQPRFVRDLGMDWVWQSRQTVVLSGVAIPHMSPEIALLVLCMHGCKHCWSRLIWICDVGKQIASHPGLDWKAAIAQARRHGLLRALSAGVLLAHRVTAVPVPDRILRRLQKNRDAAEIAKHADETLFDAPGAWPPGRYPYSLRILDFPDRMRHILKPDMLRPNERDLAAVRLPRPLHVLYPFVRPLRVLFDRTPRK